MAQERFRGRNVQLRLGRASGLTGSPDIPEPPPDRPSGSRGRIAAARDAVRGTIAAIPNVLEMVWTASPPLTLALAATSILGGVLPALTAWIAKLLVDMVVFAIGAAADPAADLVRADLPLIGPVALETTHAVVLLGLAQFGVLAASSFQQTARNVVQQLLQERVTVSTQLRIMAHASRLDLAFFEDSASYDLLRRAQAGAANRPLWMVSSLFGLLQTGITFASMVLLLIAVSPILALVAFVAPLPAFVADTRYGWRGYQLARWASPLRRRMDYLTTLVTTDTFAKEVKLFGLADFFTERFARLSRVYQGRLRALVVARYLIGFGWSTITILAGSLTYLYVALEAVAGRLTIGDLTLFTQAAASVQGSVQGLLSGFGTMYEHNLYLNDLRELLATPPGIERPRAVDRRPVGDGAPGGGATPVVTFEAVSFRYPGGRAEALHEVSFSIAPGETVAIVGRNGAGKSTLVKLLCRLYDPTEGTIRLDGVDLRELDPGAVRRLIGAAFQDFVTYQATAAENIGLGELDRLEDRAAIEAAAASGGADSLLERLPDGYDTPLGKWFDGGVELSGGEWQKVALARAFMRDARILVLDEPTAALDAQAEADLFARLRQLAAGRTAVYISHRFSTVRQADRILFLERGRLVESGTHEALMALDGRYARLFNLQASAYLGRAVDPDAADDDAEAVGGARGG